MGTLAEPVLVGRDEELKELQALLYSAVEGKGNAVFVSGEAGSGKTSLVRDFLNSTKSKGVTVLAGWCLSDAATPYFPFIEAFNSYFNRLEQEQPMNLHRPGEPLGFAGTGQAANMNWGITAWLAGPKPAERPGKPKVVSPEVWKDQVFAGVAGTLHAMASEEPIILFIEDIHWADSASIALLHYIARSIYNSERILVLATFRSEELTADAEGRSHPLHETLRLMKREELFKEIKLSGLEQDSVKSIAQSMLGGTLDSELVEKLTAQSKGNPLFVVESLRMWSEQRSLIQEPEGLRLVVDELGVPSKFKDIILRRLGSVKFSQRRVLDVASVIGEKFDPVLLGFVIGRESLEILETLDEVAQSTRLIVSEEDFFRFDHARTREILYKEISSPLKKGYHAKIAEVLERESKRKTVERLPLGSLAFHFAQAGIKEKAVEYALATGEDALARFSNSEAINAFNYVLNATEETAGYYDQRIRALFGLGNALEYGGFWAEATRVYEKLVNLAESGAMKLRALSQAIRTSQLTLSIVHVLELAAIAENYSEFDQLEYARVRSTKAVALSRRGEIEVALKETKEALRVFEEEGSLSDIAQALYHMTMYYARKDKNPVENALALALRSAALNKEVGSLRSLARFDHNLALMFMSCGIFEKAIEIYTKAVKIDEKLGAYSGLASLYSWLGFLFEARGLLKSHFGNPSGGIEDFEIGICHGLKGAQAAEKTDDFSVKMMNYGNLVRQYVKLKEMEKAEEFFKKLEKTYETKKIEVLWELAHYLRSKAIFLSAKGEWAEANRYFEESLVSFKNFKGLAFPMFIAETRIAYADALAQQRMIDQSKMQLEKAATIIKEFMIAKEEVEGANVNASLMTKREIGIDEELNMRIDLVNAASNPAIIVRMENVIPSNFKVINSPLYAKIQNDFIEMNSRKVDPFQVEPVTLTFHAQKVGVFTLNPRVIYSDHVGKTRILELEPVTITVRPMIHTKIGDASISVPILPNRLTVGFRNLDVLLYGGVPYSCSVVLNASRSDERQLLTRRFIEAGVKAGESTFYISADAGNMKELAEKTQPNLYLFLCNPQADTMIQDSPNIFKLGGIENLTEIDIAFTKVFRTLKHSSADPKRICIEIISDVLLQHRGVTTRRWLNATLSTLKSKGFTVLGVLDPKMHPPEETQAILSLFDGEISIVEKETPKGAKQTLRVKRLSNQKFIDNELTISKEKLEQ